MEKNCDLNEELVNDLINLSIIYYKKLDNKLINLSVTYYNVKLNSYIYTKSSPLE